MSNELIIRNGLIVKGTGSYTGDLDVTGIIRSPLVAQITSSQAKSASWTETASYAFVSAGTASVAVTAQTASYISQGTLTNAATGTGIASSSAQVVSYVASQQISPAGVTSSLEGTASWANKVPYSGVTGINPSSSFAGTSSYANMALTASFVLGQAATASWAEQALTASYVSTQTAQKALQGTSVVSSSAQTLVNLQSSNIVSSSAQTVSNIAGQQISPAGVTSSLHGTASWAGNATNVAYSGVTGITAGSQFAGTSSFASTAGALVSGINLNVNEITASNMQVTNLSVVTITSSVVFASGSNKFGDQQSDTHEFTGSVSISGSLAVDKTATVKELVINTTGTNATITTNEVTGVTSLTVIDSFTDTLGYAAKWLVSVRDGTNRRTSEVIAAWEATGNTASYTEYSTTDIGNTSGIEFSVDVNGSNLVRLIANPTSGNWGIRTTRLLM